MCGATCHCSPDPAARRGWEGDRNRTSQKTCQSKLADSTISISFGTSGIRDQNEKRKIPRVFPFIFFPRILVVPLTKSLV
jgi:hypothetical protein